MPFRRRFPPRRRLRRPFRRPGARQAILALRKAHQQLDQGRYSQAAESFERLADGAAQRSLPQAPNLNFQAARAHLEAGQIDRAVSRAKNGLQMLLSAGKYQQYALAERRILDHLTAKGFQGQADLLGAELETLKAGKPIPVHTGQAAQPNLPAKCPYCGGNILPDEVEWLDASTPGCSYCGSPLQSRV